ncbi:hypothetical protein PIB30_039455 [Stylosanthes scabra]|uniref:Uncharacterized protein n=1 Tax=Stylosanthes scabra TaxID=79078 RepID=A0ABU6VH52_9FABA|nr:hypothetical protein [Stylosanthes scabra]
MLSPSSYSEFPRFRVFSRCGVVPTRDSDAQVSMAARVFTVTSSPPPREAPSEVVSIAWKYASDWVVSTPYLRQ